MVVLRISSLTFGQSQFGRNPLGQGQSGDLVCIHLLSQALHLQRRRRWVLEIFRVVGVQQQESLLFGQIGTAPASFLLALLLDVLPLDPQQVPNGSPKDLQELRAQYKGIVAREQSRNKLEHPAKSQKGIGNDNEDRERQPKSQRWP